MATVTLATDIVSISGKLCSKEGVIYSVNKKTGKTYRSDRHSFTDKNSDDQQAVRALFTTKAKAAATWWNANKPTSTNEDGTEDYQALMKKYNAQTKIGNPYSYLRSLVADDGTITINGTTTTPSSSDTSDTSDTGDTTLPDLETE